MTRAEAKRLWQADRERKRQKFIEDTTALARMLNPIAYSTEKGRKEWADHIEKLSNVYC